MGAIPEDQNPHKTIAAYAKDLDIVVFNGHVHTTEVYQVDGVKYMVLGGGGAEQDPILPGRTHVKVPEDYPLDQYWKGAAPKEDYNYLLVDVRPGHDKVHAQSIPAVIGRTIRNRRAVPVKSRTKTSARAACLCRPSSYIRTPR